MNRHISFYLSIILLLTLLLIYSAVFFKADAFPPSVNRKLSDNYIARGIKLSSFQNEHLTVDLQLEKIQITGKKTGFLRLGFLKVIRFDDVILDVYPPAGKIILDRKNLLKNLKPGKKNSENNYDSSPNSIKTITKILGLSSRTIKGLEMHNILWRIHEDNLTSFKLNCQFADFDFRHKSVIFKGRVKVAVNGNKRLLETSKLQWDIEKGIFEIPYAYKFTNNGQREGGTHLTTDLYLNKLSAS